MDYSNLSQPWQQQQQNTQRIPLKRSCSFFMAHHPENWEIVIFTQTKKEEKKSKKVSFPLLLPVLSTIPEEAGVNGIRMNGKRPDSSVVQTRMRQAGWEILDPNRFDYMRLYPASNGGHYYSNKFTKIENLAGRIIKTFNQDIYNDWRRELMQDKHLNLPHKAIIQLMLIDQNRIISQFEKSQHTPEGAMRLKRAYARYQHIEDAAERVSRIQEGAYVLTS